MIQGMGFSPIRNTVPVNKNFMPMPQVDSGTDFRDVMATNKHSSIFVAISSGSERDKFIDAIHQARIFTPPTFTEQSTAKTQREPEYDISIVNNLRNFTPEMSDSEIDRQMLSLFLVPFQSKAAISLSNLFEFSLNGDENGMVTVTNQHKTVQWQFHLYGEDREFIEDLNDRIQKVMQSKESINNALERFNSGDNLSKDEILDGIIAQYANEPITMESFRTMLFDLYSSGALNPDETWLVSRWGGLGIEVVAEEYEYQQWLKGVVEEYDEPTFTTPDLLEHFLKMLDERRNANAEAAVKQEDNNDQNRKLKEAGGIYESSSDYFHNGLQNALNNLA